MSHSLAREVRDEIQRREGLRALARECRDLGISQTRIAASVRPPVDPSLVAHVFAGRAKSRRVLAAATRLRDAARRRIERVTEKERP